LVVSETIELGKRIIMLSLRLINKLTITPRKTREWCRLTSTKPSLQL
jgi:hypothetical protein